MPARRYLSSQGPIQPDRYCFLCNKSFSRPPELRRHMNKTVKHQGDAARQFSCHVCGALFTQKSNISQHVKTAHGSVFLSPQARKKKFRDGKRGKKSRAKKVVKRESASPALSSSSASTSSHEDIFLDGKPYFDEIRLHTFYPYTNSGNGQSAYEDIFPILDAAPSAPSYVGYCSSASSSTAYDFAFDGSPSSASYSPAFSGSSLSSTSYNPAFGGPSPSIPYNSPFGGSHLSTPSTSSSASPAPMMSPSPSSSSVDAQEVDELEHYAMSYLGRLGSHSMSSVQDPFNSSGANGAQYSPFDNIHGSSATDPSWVYNPQVPPSESNNERMLQLISEALHTHQFMLPSAPQQSYQRPYEYYQQQQYGYVDDAMEDRLPFDVLPDCAVQPQQQLQWLPNLCEDFSHLRS